MSAYTQQQVFLLRELVEELSGELAEARLATIDQQASVKAREEEFKEELANLQKSYRDVEPMLDSQAQKIGELDVDNAFLKQQLEAQQGGLQKSVAYWKDCAEKLTTDRDRLMFRLKEIEKIVLTRGIDHLPAIISVLREAGL